MQRYEFFLKYFSPKIQDVFLEQQQQPCALVFGGNDAEKIPNEAPTTKPELLYYLANVLSPEDWNRLLNGQRISATAFTEQGRYRLTATNENDVLGIRVTALNVIKKPEKA